MSTTRPKRSVTDSFVDAGSPFLRIAQIHLRALESFPSMMPGVTPSCPISCPDEAAPLMKTARLPKDSRHNLRERQSPK